MNDEERILVELIRNAFRGVTLGKGVGLLQGQGLDDYADAKTLADYRAQDEQEDWSRLPVEKLNSCSSSLSFFDAEGMRFHLPAYLVADLEGTLTQDVIFHLTYTDHDAMSRFEMLSADQREAVRRFILLRFDVAGNSFTAPLLEAALDGYWRS
jgi:hypothetical protein